MTADQIMEYEASLQAPDEIDADALTRYKMAAEIVNNTMARVLTMCLHGADIAQLCAFGDQLVEEQLETVFAHGQVEKGPAFPTCISRNACAAHFCPLEEDIHLLSNGDVIKISLGAQVDGYIAVATHTHIIVPRELSQQPTTGRAADVVAAAHLACEAVQRMLRPGAVATDIAAVIARIARMFKCKPVVGNFTCDQKRFVIEGMRVMWNKPDFQDHIQADWVVAEDDVFNVDIMMSTGAGKVREVDTKTTVYQRDLTKQYQLRSKAARNLYAEVSARYPTMPFSLRNVDRRASALGMKECLNHQLLTPFPVLYERKDEIIAQFKFTAVVRPKDTVRLVSQPLPYIHSVYEISDPELLELLAQPARCDGPTQAL